MAVHTCEILDVEEVLGLRGDGHAPGQLSPAPPWSWDSPWLKISSGFLLASFGIELINKNLHLSLKITFYTF